MTVYPFLGLGFNSWTQKFGREVAQEEVASNKIVVGADGEKAYVYNLDGTNEVKITASDGFDGANFGLSVGLSTNKIAVGAILSSNGVDPSGSVYLYNLDGTGEVKITASDGASVDLFGHSVAIGNDKIVVGAPGVDGSAFAFDSGAAYVYNLDGTGEVKINPSDLFGYDRFGFAVAVGSNRIVVGAYGNVGVGAAYVYNLDGTNEVKITGSNSDTGDEFGRAVAVGANKVVIGAPTASIGSTISGVVYVYDLDGTNEVKITASDAANDDSFGKSVGIGTNKIVVGAPNDDDGGSSAGAAYVYNLDGTGEVKITASDAAASDQFGQSVAIENDKIVVGSLFDDDDGDRSGSVYVYDLDGTNEVKITASDAAAGDQFGQSVAVR